MYEEGFVGDSPTGPAGSDELGGNLNKFQQQVAAVATSAATLQALLKEDAADSASVMPILKRLQEEPFKVVVIGEFSRGKSTFINALVGEKLLPSSVRPTTAVITVLRNAPDRKAVVQWRDPARRSDSIEIPKGEASKALERFVTAKSASWQEIKKVEIDIPMPHLNLPFELVDTPGVNDIDTQREEITYGFMAQADAALMILDLHQPFSASEKRFLLEKVLSSDIRKLLFVVNKIDQEPPEKLERALAYIRHRLDEIEPCRGARILPVAAKLGLLGRQGDPKALADSRLPEFEDNLISFLHEASGSERVRTACRRLLRINATLHSSLLERSAAFGEQQGQLRAAVAKAELRAQHAGDALQQASADVEITVARFVEESHREIRSACADLRTAIGRSTSRPSFPCEGDVAELRGRLNSGLRDIIDRPRRVAADAAKAVLGRRARIRKASGVGGPALELAPGVISDIQTTIGITGAIGGVLGAVLLGPLGAIGGSVLGGWLGSVFGEKPAGPRIMSSANSAIGEIENRASQAIGECSRTLHSELDQEVLEPLRRDAQQSIRTQRELDAVASAGFAEREHQTVIVRERLARAQQVATELESLGATP
jgi:ribosome biogenesis GTPase A